MEKEIEELFRSQLTSVPWIKALLAGEPITADDVSVEEVVNGIAAQARVHEQAILRLAAAIDGLNQE